MTSKQIFEYVLVELNKRGAPSLLLEDFNYFINKEVGQYVNRIYNIYEKDQQRSDDLRVLKNSAILLPVLDDTNYGDSALLGNIYKVYLPDDYLHILNCVVEYKLLKTTGCYIKDSYLPKGALRLTSDNYPQVISNYYLRPYYKRPYYYIVNNTIEVNYPTIDNQVPVIDSSYVIEVISENITTDSSLTFILPESSVIIKCSANISASALKTLIINSIPELNIEGMVTILDNKIIIKDSIISEISIKGAGLLLFKTPSSIRIAKNRYGNKSKVQMQIRYGTDDSIFKLNKVFIDYLRVPQFIRLTQDQIDEAEDTSQILEFPDYVCQEILNELVNLIMENGSNPRLQTHIPINQSISNPIQDQQRK